jgi:hypothetical protein
VVPQGPSGLTPFFGLAQLLQNTTCDEEHFTFVPEGIDREISCQEIQVIRQPMFSNAANQNKRSSIFKSVSIWQHLCVIIPGEFVAGKGVYAIKATTCHAKG